MKAEELQRMLMQSPVGFSILRGRELRFELVNAPYIEMTGRTREQLVGHAYRDAFPELAGTGTYEMLEQVYDSGEPFTLREYGVSLMRKGRAQPCYFDFTVQPTRDVEGGPVTGIMGVAIEVTELVARRREAEAMAERLRESEERFRGAQETSPDAFVALRNVRDAAGRVVDFVFLFQNEAAQRINGLEPAFVVGKRLRELFPGLLETELWGRYLRTAESGEAFRTEVLYQRDGIDAWLRIIGSRVGDGIALSFSDISAAKRMELSEREARERAEFLAEDVSQQCRDMEAALLQVREERDVALARLAELEKRHAS